ncbi:class I SAM-dependent methyltransferase [Reichenbachiella agariperforans]|uniref:class I SAM-dependent methyltransferase n=1 Tax=Reichenbachiella agariperforans TaxID=156994 RepID=UPI001C0A47D1|nr:class I SAM-dependent methyltransferase [Reichenbachiella agariperforans]MBU2915923.1 class I SAM-dependent methyltransferase [Reichenbachiella agariperforans]
MSTFTTEIASDKIVSDNPIHQRLLKAYYEAKPFVSGKVLEPGCGEGRGIELLSPLAEEYLALDKIQEVIDALKEKHTGVEFRQAVFPPFDDIPSDSFDVVISFQVIEHIQNDKLFLEEIHRVLKPGGTAIITTPNIKMSLSRNPWHIREYTSSELKALAQGIFSKVEMKGISGNEKVMTYHEQNRTSVNKIMRFDIFNLQHKLPAPILRIPYEILNRLNRNKLQDQDAGLVAEIHHDDFYLADESDQNLDLFCILTK